MSLATSCGRLCAIAAVRVRLKRLAAPAIYASCTRTALAHRVHLAAPAYSHTCASAKKIGRGGSAAAASDSMILLQLLVDLSQGKYDASSVKDKRQLARVASVVKECFFVADQRTRDSDYVTCDKAAVIRRFVKEFLEVASKMTFEDREQLIIVQMDRNVKLMQSYQDVLEAGRSFVRLRQELNAESEMVRAEAARAKADLQQAEAEHALFEAKMRIWEKSHREYMESGDDYGERELNYRKRALEGDADAAAYFAEREQYLRGRRTRDSRRS